MSAPINTGGPAFPVHVADYRVLDGMTLRQYAAIKLRVPDSGEEWLDDMIRSSLRADFAAAALPAIISAIDRHNSIDPERAKGEGFCADDGDQRDAIEAVVDAYIVADHMLAARQGGAA